MEPISSPVQRSSAAVQGSTRRLKVGAHVIVGALAAALTLAVSVSSCSTIGAPSGGSASLDGLDLDRLPSAASYPDDDGIFLLRRLHYDVHATKRGKVYLMTRHRVARLIFRRADEQADHQLVFAGDEVVEEITARTIQSDGTIVEIRPEEFHVSTGGTFDGVLYSDMHTVSFAFPAVRDGSIVEYEYRARQPGFVYEMDWFLQTSIPILRNQFVLTVPAELVNQHARYGPHWNWNYRIFNHPPLPQLRVEVPESVDGLEDKVTYSWDLGDVPARATAPMMPAAQSTARVRFAPAKWTDWNALSSEYWKDTIAPKVSTDGVIRARAVEISAASQSDDERIALLYEHVRGMRYVAVLLEGGNDPREPSDVLRTGYGDCKDKSVLLVSLLNSIGIEANLVLLAAGESTSPVAENFPSWSFNHMIVKASGADGEVYWLDPTATYTPFGDIPWSDEGRAVLVLNADGTSQLEHTPRIPAADNRTDYDVRVEARKDGPSNLAVAVRYSGQNASNARARFSQFDDADFREFCKSRLSDGFAGARVQSHELAGLTDLDDTLTLRCQFSVAGVARQQGELYLIDAMPLKPDLDIAWLASETRTYPIEFDFPFTIKRTVAVRFVDTPLKLQAAPDRLQLVDDDFSYSRNATDSGMASVIEEVLVVNNTSIQPSKWPQLAEALQNAAQHSSEKLVFVR